MHITCHRWQWKAIDQLSIRVRTDNGSKGLCRGAARFLSRCSLGWLAPPRELKASRLSSVHAYTRGCCVFFLTLLHSPKWSAILWLCRRRVTAVARSRDPRPRDRACIDVYCTDINRPCGGKFLSLSSCSIYWLTLDFRVATCFAGPLLLNGFALVFFKRALRSVEEFHCQIIGLLYAVRFKSWYIDESTFLTLLIS